MGKLCQGSSYIQGTGPCCDQPWCKVGKGKGDKQHTQTSSNTKGTTLNRDGTKLHRDGTKLHRDGTELHRDGTKLNRDGTELHRDEEIPELSNMKVTTTREQAKSTFTKPRDQTMAARQTRIETLPPAERKEQEEWAQDQLKQNAGQCAAGFAWFRIQGGYRCYGGSHMVTDEILAEGKGGFYCIALFGVVQPRHRELGFDRLQRDGSFFLDRYMSPKV